VCARPARWGVERDEFVPTAEYSHLFDQPGVYPYYCSIHGTSEAGMVGATAVTEPA
jgi:plastocyanin